MSVCCFMEYIAFPQAAQGRLPPASQQWGIRPSLAAIDIGIRLHDTSIR